LLIQTASGNAIGLETFPLNLLVLKEVQDGNDPLENLYQAIGKSWLLE
jgi:hypothetical protein